MCVFLCDRFNWMGNIQVQIGMLIDWHQTGIIPVPVFGKEIGRGFGNGFGKELGGGATFRASRGAFVSSFEYRFV